MTATASTKTRCCGICVHTTARPCDDCPVILRAKTTRKPGLVAAAHAGTTSPSGVDDSV